MPGVRRNVGFLMVLAGLAVPLAVVSVAFACGRLATLYLFPRQAKQGATVGGYGRNFNVAPNASPVTLHFNSRTGNVLWTGRPNPAGQISPSFQVPNVRSGYYLIMAEQNGPNGAPAAGTPGRAVLFIGSRRSRHHAARGGLWLPSGAGGSGPRASAAPSGLHVGSQTALLASLLSGTLLAGGVFVLREDRRRRRRAPVAP